MKELQNYKIEPGDLNLQILHKAVEEGYENKIDRIEELKTARYLYFSFTGAVSYGEEKKWFEKDSGTKISAHDFLRLNWTPKVGEEVECVESFGSFVLKGHIYTVSVKANDSGYISLNGSRGHYNITRFIPVYPKKQLRFKTEQEKPDAYIIGGDGGVFASIVARINNEDEQRMCDLDLLTSMYRIVSKATYKAKYPDKLMFKEWEVIHDSPRVHIGCITTTEFLLRTFLRETEEASDKELNSVTLLDLRKFLIENKEKLSLKVMP